MKPSGIFISESELKALQPDIATSGMLLSGGRPMGDPGETCRLLIKKYNMPIGSAINSKTGEFYTQEVADDE